MGYIYKISSEQTDRVYIGSCVTSLERRFAQHKRDLIRYVSTGKNYISSLEVCMFPDSKIELVEEIDCHNILDLRKAEQRCIENEPNTCNMVRAYLSPENKRIERAKLDRRRWVKYNERLKADLRRRYYEHKEERNRYSRNYYKENRDQINKKRYAKVQCGGCKKEYAKSSLSRHRKTCRKNI